MQPADLLDKVIVGTVIIKGGRLACLNLLSNMALFIYYVIIGESPDLSNKFIQRECMVIIIYKRIYSYT
jgi:hypothetical protein